jgi:hypothetical protein
MRRNQSFRLHTSGFDHADSTSADTIVGSLVTIRVHGNAAADWQRIDVTVLFGPRV